MEPVVPERCDIAPGDVIGGRYTVDHALGEGSFGSVYKVHNPAGEVYALKLMKLWTVPPEVCDGLRQRFVMEFETGQIQSRYLAHSYAYGDIKGNPYIIMEFCTKGDLRSYVSTHRVDFVKVGREILLGLGELHAHGKVHRDLKPENVLLRSDDTAVLTDFGISGDRNKRLTERGRFKKPSQIFGTYPYMPPEQVNPPRGGQATVLPTTDIFSFGVMMYEMLVGCLPFGELSEATLYRYLENGRRGIWDRDALKKADRKKIWTEIIEGCLVSDFKSRIQSVAEIVKMLPPDATASAEAPAESPQSFMKIKKGLLLRVMQGEEYGKEYRLEELAGEKGILTVGRNTEDTVNNLPIKETFSQYISRRHCTFEKDRQTGQWIIRDGQWIKGDNGGRWKCSLNGTYINSSEVDMYGLPVIPGDIISMGDVKLRVEGY